MRRPVRWKPRRSLYFFNRNHRKRDLKIPQRILPVCAAALAAIAMFSGCGQKNTATQPITDQSVNSACGMKMVGIPAGEFLMGADDGPVDVKPAHRVKVNAFLMDQTLVTQDVFQKIMGSNPSRRKNPMNPVEQASWTAAVKFCNARSIQEGLTPCYDLKTLLCDFNASGYRLPTEAEWEYACRAGTATKFYFGDNEDNLKSWAWFRDNSDSQPHPVAQKKPNPWGLYDMAGNLWEWCNDFYGARYYRTSPADNPPGPDHGEKRVLRGGAWSSDAAHCASWARGCDESGATPPPQPTSGQSFASKAPGVEPPRVSVGQLGKTVAALLRQNAALCEFAGPLPGITPVVSVPLSVPVSGEAVFPTQPPRPFPSVLAGGIAGLVLAIGMVAGWHLFHPKAHSARVENVTAQQANSPAPLADVAGPTVASVNTVSAASEAPEERPLAPALARKSRRVKAATVAKAAPAVPAPDPKTAELASLQNLAREAFARGNYAEPREASAIAYSQQALALDPSNDSTRTLLESSIKGGEYQIQQAILRKDFTTAHRIADVLGQLLPGGSAVADLKADLASAEKAEEESRRVTPVPAAILSFRVHHMHSGKANSDKGSYCRGTLSVVAGRLKYVGETAEGGQVHSFDLACSEVVQVRKGFRVAFWEKGFYVRTASSNINFVPEDASASQIRALASACSK